MDMDPTAINESLDGTLAALLGIRFVEASPDRVIAELAIRDDLRTVRTLGAFRFGLGL